MRHKLFPAFLFLLLLVSPAAVLATSASISVSGTEGAIPLSASATFSEYDGDSSGTLYVYHGSGLIAKVGGSGSASWSTTLDGGAMSQGDHTFTATAVDSKGISHSQSVTMTIDNTPSVTVNSPGQVEGAFDVTGTAVFKEYWGGAEGTVCVEIDSYGVKTKSYEGKSITWSYDNIVGATLDGGWFSQGTHTIRAWAVAHNGAVSPVVTATFVVDNTPQVTVSSPGQVEGAFDVTGTAVFKEYWGGAEGTVCVEIDHYGVKTKSYEGKSITWSYDNIVGATLDGGWFSQGTHTIRAWAVAHNGAVSPVVTATFVVDNTPQVTVSCPGQVEGNFDITGTATFKQYLGGAEGGIFAQIDNYRTYSKVAEGTSVNWSYNQMVNGQLNAGLFSQGGHTVRAWAAAHNGAPSAVVTGTFNVTQLSTAKNLGPCDGSCPTRTLAGNPINFATGNKYQKERDFDLRGPGLPLGFSRHYNSQSTLNTSVGYGWTATFSDYLTFATGKVVLHQSEGAEVHFISDGQGKFVSETDKVRVIEPVTEGYSLKEQEGRVLGFGADGKFLRIADRIGNTQTLAYSSGRLASVEDNFGRRLDFAYGANGKLATLTTPTGSFTYAYDGQGNLSMVTRPDQTTRTYLYEDTNDVHNLTGILNEKGIRSLTVQYDNQDRGILSEGAGGAKRVTIAYDNNFVRHVTDSLGRTTTFRLHVEKGIARVKNVSGDGCGSCLGSLGEQYAFDSRLYVTEETDAQGVVTTYTHDERGNVLTRKEGAGTTLERTSTYTYHPILDLIASITKSSVANPGASTTTSFAYDGAGNLLTRTESGFSGGTAVTRTTTYTYNKYGQVTRMDGPRTDVPDVTTFEYYPNTPDRGLNRGRLKKISDALGFETLFSQYNAFGKPWEGTDPNGVVTTYTYDLMGRVKTKVTGGLSTTFSYDEGGAITLTRYPDGREFTYTYTDQGWLEKITSLAGSINYIYDTEGNRTREEIKNAQAAVQRYTVFAYDNRNRLRRTTYPDSTYEERSYDDKGTLLGLLDPKGQNTSYAYDLLSRLAAVTQPGNVVTAYAYDKHDNLVSVTDGENQVTSYTFDDLGRLVSTLSPDTNTTAYTYDPSGNLLSKTDANGTTATYSYDILNRLTAISFPDSTQNISFTYDQGVNGKGRLTAMQDPGGSSAYTYDPFGNLVNETRTTAGIPITIQYSYKQGGPLQGITYPSGRAVTYERDGAGQVIRVTETKGGTTRTLADNVSHLPFGPLKGLTYGNGLVETRAFDEMYRLTALEAGSVMRRSYSLDPVGNITSIADLLDPSRSQSLGYDDLSRLTSAQGIYGSEGYAYDKVGNRLARTLNSQAETYAYVSGTNKLQAISGVTPVTMSYDPNGNTLSMGDKTFTYNQDNRLIRASVGGAVAGAYTYNGKGERVRKVAEGKTTLYVYDKDGNLIAEADETGTILREYVYLEGKLLSLISTEPPKDIEVRVSTDKGRKLSGIRVYAFTEAGAYTGKSATTDTLGLAVFQNGLLSDGNCKFRADYLSYQFWSPVIAVPGGNAADVVIAEETAAITVTVAGEAKPGVKVYLFNGAGTYLGLSQTSDSVGKVFFDLPVGKTFKFRADYLGSQYWSNAVTIQAGVTNTIALATDGGSLKMTLKKDESTPLQGVKIYLFSPSGTYLNLSGTLNENGEFTYLVSGGNYKVRADYLGYQFWSDVIGVYGNTASTLMIPHKDVKVKLEGNYNANLEARVNVNAYLFTPAGMYLNVTAKTNDQGEVTFSLPSKDYKVRADYLSRQYWSDVFNWQDKTITVNEGLADITVTNIGYPLQGINVYAFSNTGTYVGLSQVTDSQGKVSFRLPEGGYKFRADYMGSQFWSGDTTLVPHVVNPIPISTGGGSFTLRVERSPGVPLAGVKCYLFSASGTYLSQQAVTSGQGEVGFNLADGSYKIRIDYLGYQLWTSPFPIPGTYVLTHSIPHQDVTITVKGDYSGNQEAKTNIDTYLFSPSGTYLNVTKKTDSEGKVLLNLPQKEYKLRADYLGGQYFSEIFNWADKVLTINEGMAVVNVNQNSTPLANVDVYVFTNSGSYLNLHGKSGGGGTVSFRLPEGTYRFRGDYQGSQFWVTEAIPANQVKTVNLDTGGGLFTLKVEKAQGQPLTNTPVYVFTPSGSYLNITAQTNTQGEVTFGLASGWYRFRVDYMGYQFWCDSLQVPNTLSYTMSVPHRNVTTTVSRFYTGGMVPSENTKVYLFTESGSYQNLNADTNAQGQVTFTVPDQNYKVRVDYLGGQFWSEIFRWQDKEVVIDEGMVDLRVSWNGANLNNVPVYLFTDTSTYLSRNANTDAQGHVQFTVPVKPYKFRVDYNGRQYWTPVINLIAHQKLDVEVPLEQLAMIPTNDPLCKRMDHSKEPEILAFGVRKLDFVDHELIGQRSAQHETSSAFPQSSMVNRQSSIPSQGIRVASIGSLIGILSQAVVAQVSQPKVYYYITDHLGTPQKVVDQTGVVVWSGDYRPFGEVSSGVSTVPNNFRFPGQQYDSETGLHYNYFRHYQPKTGRYITPDPIGLAAGINLYAYVADNPPRFSDPLGLWKGEGHRKLTIDPMLARGFSQQDTQWAAEANMRVDAEHFFDDEHHGTPSVLLKTHELINDQLEKAILLELLGYRRAAMEALGEGMHPLQDIPAHQPLGATSLEMWWLHGPFSSHPDNECIHPERFSEASERTKWYLEKFLMEVTKRTASPQWRIK